MIEIQLDNVEKYYGTIHVLKGISLELKSGEKVGVVGRNGTGKTTIFKLISGVESCDHGQVHLRKGISIGYLPQIPQFPSHYTVRDVLEEAFDKHFNLQKELRRFEKELSNPSEPELGKILRDYGKLQQEFELMGGYAIENKIAHIRTGLQINDEQLKQSFATLSGGEQSTVLLARVLLGDPDLLLLDEPSNHLDFQALEWLETFLADSKQTVMVISHDRYFLEQTVTRIIEVEDGLCRSYPGSYQAYVEQKSAFMQERQAAYDLQTKKIKTMEKTIRELKEWGVRADNPKFHRRAGSMQKRLDKIERIKRPKLQSEKLNLDFKGELRSGRDVVEATGLVKQYTNLKILDRADLHVQYGERVAIVGRNGTGKSTLLKIVLGEVLPESGHVQIGANVRVGYLEQEVRFPDNHVNLIESLRNVRPMSEGEARARLAKFHFYGDDVFKKVAVLSGGEKSRLRLCHLVHTDINFLVLDEPTNHLDIPALESLEEALAEFEGSLLFVSHDRHFINVLGSRVVELANGKIHSYQGDYDYYRLKKAELSQEEAQSSTKEPTLKRFESRKPVHNLYKITDLERQIEDLEHELSLLGQKIMEAATNYVLLQQLYEERQSLQNKYDALFEEWAELTP